MASRQSLELSLGYLLEPQFYPTRIGRLNKNLILGSLLYIIVNLVFGLL